MKSFSHALDVGDGKVLLGFALPIYQRVVPSLHLNQELVETALRLERMQPSGQKRSNVGSWRSQGNIFSAERANESLLLLREQVAECVRDLISHELELDRASSRRITFKIDGWINVLRHGAYHTVHTHPGASWAGVYYVTAGSSGDAEGSGMIEFISTSAANVPYRINGKPIEASRKLRIVPSPGMLLLFPGTLWHGVLPYYGVSPRITLAFNVSDVSVLTGPDVDAPAEAVRARDD